MADNHMFLRGGPALAGECAAIRGLERRAP